MPASQCEGAQRRDLRSRESLAAALRPAGETAPSAGSGAPRGARRRQRVSRGVLGGRRGAQGQRRKRHSWSTDIAARYGEMCLYNVLKRWVWQVLGY
jgi:hypothetical protein